MDATVIRYVSAPPGTGKTHKTINRMVSNIKNNVGITLIVVPTNDLSDQVVKDILKPLKNLNPEYLNRLHQVKGDDGKDTLSTTKEAILTLISGSSDHKAQPDGTVIVCTHAAFSLLPHDYMLNEEIGNLEPVFKDRPRVSVIYDEARSCVEKAYSINLPFGVAEKVLNAYFKFDAEYSTKFRLATEHFKTSIDFRKLFISTVELNAIGKQLTDMFKNAKNSSFKIYVRYNKYSRNDKTKIKNSEDSVCLDINIISSPHKLFYGWESVTLMSAFFETSEMYHVLKSKNRNGAKNSENSKNYYTNIVDPSLDIYKFKLINATKNETSAVRRDDIKNRRMQTSITYLGEKSVSKGHINDGVLVNLNSTVKDSFNYSEFNKTFSILSSNKLKYDKQCKVKKISLRFVLTKIIDYKNKDKTLFTPNQYDIELMDHVKTLPGLVSNYTPLQWYATESVRISTLWYEEFKNKLGNRQPIPITINVGGGRYQKEVEKLQNLVSYASDKENADYRLMNFQTQGNNSYQSMHTIAFLATLNPTPDTKVFLKALTESYDSSLDCTLDQAIQSLTRCSIRDANSGANPLLIVTDLVLAKKVIEHFDGDIKLIHPIKFGLVCKDPYAVEPDDVKAKAKVRATNFQKTDEAKDRNIALADFKMTHSLYHAEINRKLAALSRMQKSEDFELGLLNTEFSVLNKEIFDLEGLRELELPKLLIIFNKSYNYGDGEAVNVAKVKLKEARAKLKVTKNIIYIA